MIEFRRLEPALERPLADFFQHLKASGDETHFHPHPLDAGTAKRLCAEYRGADLYFAAVIGGEIAGYGILRGWDEGFPTPSLGIAIASGMRGRGLGEALMHFLHCAARLKGSQKVRLKVYRDNPIARRLYEKLGYVFAPAEGGQDLGILEL